MNILKTLKDIAKNNRAITEIFKADLQIGSPKLCVITGNNTSGKSVLRKILHLHHDKQKVEYIHLSQSGRSHSSGLFRVAVYGSEEDESTGYNSSQLVTKAIKNGQQREKPFSLMFDEPEIGCSEELALSLGMYLADKIETMPHLAGMFVVTHSRQIVKALLPLNPTHFRMGGDQITLEQWMNREISPISIEELQNLGIERWRAVQQIINENKK